ncbi:MULTISPECIES: hypothetical protein [Ramlibacter]|uniref:Uncharacterized protein n=1 Tax=Ramlibacter pinisoli TaxID=2682844 RepID=A0A6N8IQZ3_9BURK|nr:MULTISPECIES: hypothetical protein [Ramlibacter]MBA2964302.1 hypothetical protein [Ramlibacter sp. CGMCC 1.13660]MVQ29268.1 hypothetical protein [Ramlibacter pinisoli]
MNTRSTRVTGSPVTHFFTLAVLAAALAGCGGGGGAVSSNATSQPTGSTVTAQTDRQPAGAAALAPDPATRVNTDSAGAQTLRAIGATSDGGYSVSWFSQPPGATAALRLQHFDATGARSGADHAVTLDAGQNGVAAAVLPDGGLAVATAVVATGADTEPWITRSSIVVRRHDANGSPARAPVEVAAITQDRTGATTMRYVAQPSVARWADGSFVVGWQVIEETAGVRTPQAWTQRFDALGNPIGSPVVAGRADADTSYQLIAVPTGGYIVATAQRVMGRTFIQYAGFDGAVAPVFPAGALGTAEGSLLLPLEGGGMVLFAPAHTYGSVQRYAGDGQPAGSSTSLPAMPLAAVALPGGGWITFSASGGAELSGQRFDAGGQREGDAFAVAPGALAPQGAVLQGGSLGLAWTTDAGGDTDVMTQRLRP